jgi:hypothetical protein
MIIPMIIQTIGLDPSGAVWTDEASNVSRLDPSGAIQSDAEHPHHHRKVDGSNPTSGSRFQVRAISEPASLPWRTGYAGKTARVGLDRRAGGPC